ncbi:MAG TPA: glutamine amidotransferase [Labilithrix sp.]|nr:glutamine amidotransferase [Labilithrix sp.]
MKLVVLRTGDAAPTVAARRGEFFSWIRREAGAFWEGEWSEHDVRNLAEPLPRPSDADGFIITGSSSSVTERAPWMLRAEVLIRELAQQNVPLFGICFGHQLIAAALGGEVARNPRGREIGTIEVRRFPTAPDDPLVAGLPTTFRANASHVDTVVRLPEGASVLAETDLEPHAMYVVGETTKCVQFHPEFDGDAMRGYVEARAHLVSAEGLDPQAILERTGDTPDGAETLRNFIRYVVRPHR